MTPLLPFCGWYPHSVVLYLLTLTTTRPTECFLMLLVSSDLLHPPLLRLCMHPLAVPVLALSMLECLVRWCLDVFRAQLLYAFSSVLLLQSKLMPGKAAVNVRKI